MTRRRGCSVGWQTAAFPCLVVCYILFLVLGALVFRALEMPVEKALQVEVEELRRTFLKDNPCVQETKLQHLLGKALSAHHTNVAVLLAEEDERHYDFTSSLYFVIVTLTTMGSDVYYPQSDESKFFCLVYCIIGIPLTLFLLGLLSETLLLPVLTYAPVRHLHTFWGLSLSRAALLHASLLSVLVLSLLFLLPALLISAVEPKWSFLDALFFCFVVLSTVGQGGCALGRSWSLNAREALELLTTCYLLLGLIVIFTLKKTVFEVPQFQALLRLLSGPQCSELDRVSLHVPSLEGPESLEGLEGLDGPEEELQYSTAICTISSSVCKAKPE
ncbi:potassium channel, subfamily K, member 7 [Eucyclogobius newberryi]|uniref:potassium channel, subfamily K, member 7 n=1 Tax=Eucyclogobius newberryi TaxID=166745 RepID=UPI003B59C0E4